MTEPTWSGGRPAPENDRQHPDFPPGNTMAVKHGGFSDRLVKPRAMEIAQGLADDGALPGYLQESRYRPAVLAYCMVLARIERVDEWLERMQEPDMPPELASDGSVRAATRLLMDLERRADTFRRDLGLTPLAAARLGKDVAAQQVSLSQMWAQMDEADGDA